MTNRRPASPAIRPACSDDLPRVGETVWTVRRSSFTGSAPKLRSAARFLAWSSLKLPEIWTWPPKLVGVAADGWVIGALITLPSRSMAMMAWNCCWARVSQAWLPVELSDMLTTHCPFWRAAVADPTPVPERPAGPST